MLTWTELAAYLMVVGTVFSGGVALCYVALWRE